MGKSPPSITSPDKLKRLVEILENQSGTVALKLSPNAQSSGSSRAADRTMMPSSRRKTLWR